MEPSDVCAFTITEPGLYKLGNSIIFGTNNGQIICPNGKIIAWKRTYQKIIINTSNTTLDLQGFSIACAEDICAKELDAITIRPRRKNITICNGSIEDFVNGYAVLIEKNSEFDAIFDRSVHVALKNILFRHVSKPLGLYAALNVLLENITLPLGVPIVAKNDYSSITFKHVYHV
jgi:hypothetical protein